MIMMILLAAASLGLIYTGMKLYERANKTGCVIIDLAMDLFLIAVITFVKKELGLDVGKEVMGIWVVLTGVIATAYIVKSCKTAYIINQYS